MQLNSGDDSAQHVRVASMCMIHFVQGSSWGLYERLAGRQRQNVLHLTLRACARQVTISTSSCHLVIKGFGKGSLMEEDMSVCALAQVLSLC